MFHEQLWPAMCAVPWTISEAVVGELSVNVQRGELPCRVARVNVETGRRELWREIAPADAAGVVAVPRVIPTPDGKAYFYNFRRILSELYVADGIE